jgi:hypothetical protein
MEVKGGGGRRGKQKEGKGGRTNFAYRNVERMRRKGTNRDGKGRRGKG